MLSRLMILLVALVSFTGCDWNITGPDVVGSTIVVANDSPFSFRTNVYYVPTNGPESRVISVELDAPHDDKQSYTLREGRYRVEVIAYKISSRPVKKGYLYLPGPGTDDNIEYVDQYQHSYFYDGGVIIKGGDNITRPSQCDIFIGT